jgi:hypothetical protein
MERSADFALAMLVLLPEQHEVTNESRGVAQRDGDGQEIGVNDATVVAESAFEHDQGLISIARFGVQIAVDRCVTEDLRQVIEIAALERAQRESRGRYRSSELNHTYVLAFDAMRYERADRYCDVFISIKERS